MDQAQFSRIESGKTDPAFSTIVKIAGALAIGLAELMDAGEAFREVSSYDKSLMEKLALIEQLEDKEKAAFFSILDALVSKKKLKDALSGALEQAK
jgi:transcriptional regulator with XRE-family HTH domain